MQSPGRTRPERRVQDTPMTHATTPPLKLAVIGAGPAGLALALLAAQTLPNCTLTVFDARPADKDVSADPRTLALSLGSVQLLERLGVWPPREFQAIEQVHISQAPPSWDAEASVRLSAQEQGVPMLGAVVRYGTLVAALQMAWQHQCDLHPERCMVQFGHPVSALTEQAQGVQVDAGVADLFDLAVVAEGGVFADQARKALAHDYQQTAWVGSVQLSGGVAGVAFERFTRHGPVALLPLPFKESPGRPATRPAALVWCVDAQEDPVAPLTDEQRRLVLNQLLPAQAGEVVQISPLKHFALGLNAERTLVQGRQLRIGNAAQTLHPVAGQGLNLGLRDAYALVQALRSAGDAPGGLDAQGLSGALRRVEWQRAPDRWSMIATTDFLARSFTWRWPGVAAARGLALGLLQALPPVKKMVARHMMFGRR